MIMELLYKKYASYNVLTEEHRTFVLDIIKPLLFDGEKAGWNYSENYSGNGMHTHPGLHLNPKLGLFYDRVVEDFKTLVGKEPVIKNSWALWTNGQYVNWHNHQNADFSIDDIFRFFPTIFFKIMTYAHQDIFPRLKQINFTITITINCIGSIT